MADVEEAIPNAGGHYEDSLCENEQPEAPAGNTRKLLRKLSTSEQAEAEYTGRLKAPSWLQWFEYPFRVTNPTTGRKLVEATGWSMDAGARGTINQAGSFLGAALLGLATVDANCQRPSTCENTVHGLKPSSLLTTTSTIVGVAAAILMPFVGAVVDHTRHRKTVGVISAFIVVLITGIQISISQDNWFTMLILEAIGGFFLLVHATAVFAYLPDLSEVEEDLAHYTSRFNLRQYAIQTFYTGVVVLITEIRGAEVSLESTVRTARDGLIMACSISLPLMAYAWTFLFKGRESLTSVPEGSNLLTAGFVKVGNTAGKIWSKYRALKWFLVSLLWSPEAGAGVMLSITVTFMAVYLEMTGQQIGFTSLAMLACNLPGSLLSKWMCLKVNPLNSYRLSLLFFTLVTVGTFATLSGPERQKLIYLWSALWGVSYGWVYPSQRVLFCTLIPPGQETEMMGVFAFAGQILGWLPPLIFTILNQKGVDMRWATSIIPCVLFLSFLFTLVMGNYADAVAQVAVLEEKEADVTLEQEESSRTEEGNSNTFEEQVAEEVPGTAVASKS